VASSEGTSSSQPTRGVSREDHGGSDGLDLEVVTVTSMDVPLARGQSWGHICLKRRLGKVVTLSTQGRGNQVW